MFGVGNKMQQLTQLYNHGTLKKIVGSLFSRTLASIFRSDQMICSPGMTSVQNGCLVIIITRSFPRN